MERIPRKETSVPVSRFPSTKSRTVRRLARVWLSWKAGVNDQKTENAQLYVGEGEAYSVPVDVTDIRYVEGLVRKSSCTTAAVEAKNPATCSTR